MQITNYTQIEISVRRKNIHANIKIHQTCMAYICKYRYALSTYANIDMPISTYANIAKYNLRRRMLVRKLNM